jgi:hypothetical protein
MDDSRGSAQGLDRSTTAAPVACLAPGCPCKDVRIVSHRRAAFFASVARNRGETANRRIDADPTWRLPLATA